METPAADGSDVAHRARSQQISMVFGQTARNQVLSPIVGAFLAFAIWPVIDSRLAAGWVLALSGVSLWRQRLANQYHRSLVDQHLVLSWERRFLVSLAVASATWGIGAWLIMPAHANAYQALVYCFVVGMAGGTSAIYAAHGPSVAIAISLIIGPCTVYLASFGDPFHATMAAGGVLFALAASRGVRVMNDTMHRNIELADELERSACIDLLSGLNNRRGFTEFSATALANASRSNRSCALIMIDVDHFKAINDRMGHAAGDAVIRALGILLTEAIRTGECAARIGGEEFAVMLPDADEQQAATVATRILKRVRATQTPTSDGHIMVTVSLGVASTGAPCTLDELLVRADGAMYTAKRNGRDRVVLASQSAVQRISPS